MERNCLNCTYLSFRVKGQAQVVMLEGDQMKVVPGNDEIEIMCEKWYWRLSAVHLARTRREEGQYSMTCGKWEAQEE